MKKLRQMLAIGLLLATGCGSLGAPHQSTGLPVRYHNAKYGLTLFLPAGWRGYSVLSEQWDGETYSPATDKTIVVGHGTMITLRHPQGTTNASYQDIPILVFTRAQWDALHHGMLWPSFLAGGMVDELWHNQEYVFGMSSRYNWGELNGSEEVARVVEQNRMANTMQRLYAE